MIHTTYRMIYLLIISESCHRFIISHTKRQQCTMIDVITLHHGFSKPKVESRWRYNKLYKYLQKQQQLQPFNGLFSRTTWVSRYQKGKTNLDFTGARDSEWQWHQLGHMQVCTLLQTDNHASTPPLGFYRPDALPAAQSTASKH